MLTTLILLALLVPALAQEPPPAAEVVVPWGEWVIRWLNGLQEIILLVLSAASAYVVSAYVPSWVRMFAGQAAQNRVNQVLEKAVLSAIAQTKGAVTGKRVTVDVGYQLLARAAQYAVDQAPVLIDEAAQTTENLLKMIAARMEQVGVAPDGAVIPPKVKDAQGKPSKADFDFSSAITKGFGRGV
jgi:hypothetical protein